MGRKTFVSYKYADDQVKNIDSGNGESSTARSYVDFLEPMLKERGDVYKGEHDGEDLSYLSDDTIWEKLRDRIYDSSLTLVLISPNMRDHGKRDRDQWIPWEISYSLKAVSRRNSNGDLVTSRTNAMIAVVLPDASGSYQYYLEDCNCSVAACVTHHIDDLFYILRKNKFNKVNPACRECATKQEKIWPGGDSSYIEAVKWDDFIADPDLYIERAYDRRDNLDLYDIVKDVEERK